MQLRVVWPLSIRVLLRTMIKINYITILPFIGHFLSLYRRKSKTHLEGAFGH